MYPVIPAPQPINTAPTTLVLSSLALGTQYTIRFTSRSLAGVASATSTAFSWHVLAAAPLVHVTLRPDTVSGSINPRFAFAADWAGAEPDGAGNVTFEVPL